MITAARAALFTAILLPGASVADAASAPVFALKAVGYADLGYYRFHASPGQTVRGSVRLVNAGKVAGTADLSVVDAATGATTGAVYQTVGSRSSDVGAWVSLQSAQVTLAPGASKVVAFAVTVPAAARRGQHLGGLVARPLATAAEGEAGTAKHSFRVNIVDQSILAVQVDLPGAARGLLKVRDVHAGGNPGYQTLLLALSNPGEKMVKGRGTVVVSGPAGQVIKRQDFAIDTFLPRTRIEYPLVMRGKALVPGNYRAEVLLHWDGGQSSKTRFTFAVTKKNIVQAYGQKGLAQLPGAPRSGDGLPVALLAGGGLLVMLLGFGGTALYFRRRTRELEHRFGGPPEGDGEIRVADQRGPLAPTGEAEEPVTRA